MNSKVFTSRDQVSDLFAIIGFQAVRFLRIFRSVRWVRTFRLLRTSRFVTHNLHAISNAYFGFFVTPLLWALLIAQLALANIMAVAYMLFFAADESCEMMVKQMQEQMTKMGDAASTASAQSQEAQQAAMEQSQASQLSNQMGSVDKATGMNGFSSGIEGYLLSDTQDYMDRLEGLCEELRGLNDGTIYIWAGAMALIILEAIIIVRNHIFFERDFYERRLALRNDQLEKHRILLDREYPTESGDDEVVGLGTQV